MLFSLVIYGAGEGIRTLDPNLGKINGGFLMMPTMPVFRRFLFPQLP
jgi:hypothetical protein